MPANTTARVYVPTSSPTETFVANGGAAVTYVGYQNGAQVFMDPSATATGRLVNGTFAAGR